MKNKIGDLRDHLFATIESLRDEEEPMDLERAKTISAVAQTIINSAKAETDRMKLTGGSATGFIPLDQDERPQIKGPRAVEGGKKR